jgi:hypothetical protein
MALNAEQRPSSAKQMRAMLWDVKDDAPLADGQTFTDNSPKTNIYSQKTKVYSDASRISNLKQSDIKTETFSNDESKVTQLKPQFATDDFEKDKTKVYPVAGPTSGKKSRRGLAIGAVLGGLLLALGAIAAVYAVKPEFFNVHKNETNTEPEKKPVIVVVQDNTNLAEANANSAGNANAVAEVPALPANPLVPTEPKPKETVAKTETKQTETKSKTEAVAPNKRNTTASVDEPPEINVDDDDDDDTGEPPVNPQTRQKFPIQLWRKMTPEQRRKLRQALDMERQQEMERRRLENQRRNLPKPPQTPYN